MPLIKAIFMSFTRTRKMGKYNTQLILLKCKIETVHNKNKGVCYRINTFAETLLENYKIFKENIEMKFNNFSLLVFANSNSNSSRELAKIRQTSSIFQTGIALTKYTVRISVIM